MNSDAMMNLEQFPAILRIGTRASRLARWQAEWVAERLGALFPRVKVELVLIRTQGDRDQSSPLSAIGGTGLFTKEIQRALLDGRADLAVHSLKDLPTAEPPGLVIAAVPPRAPVSDALVAPVHRTLEALPPGARIGTSSLRRGAQLLHLYPSLQIVSIRGNVDTRLALAVEQKVDGVVLALAGLHRLGLDAQMTQHLDPPRFLPAVGQGALAIECRADDRGTRALALALDCAVSHAAVEAERAALSALGGGCLVPMGAWARTLPSSGEETSGLALDVAVFSPLGEVRLGASVTGSLADPVALGRDAAERLRAQGAEQFLQATQE